jgi:hypothetical protein
MLQRAVQKAYAIVWDLLGWVTAVVATTIVVSRGPD